MMSYSGYGLLLVSGSKVRQRIKPRPQPWHRIKRQRYRMQRLMARQPAMDHELAGLPANRALWLQRRMRGD